jgi:hypothetical protein
MATPQLQNTSVLPREGTFSSTQAGPACKQGVLLFNSAKEAWTQPRVLSLGALVSDQVQLQNWGAVCLAT